MRTARQAIAQCLGCQNKSIEWTDHAKSCLLFAMIDKEQARWQQRIYALLEKECPSINIDGSGCDSGDPLDLTEAEVHQALLHWKENHADVKAEHSRLYALLNTPELTDFPKAVVLEAAHQRERWGSQHDEGKTPEDWFWLTGYLAGKALHSLKFGDVQKGLHHIITTAAVLSNWHAQLLGKCDMRPGLPAEKQPKVAEVRA
jgi:hypothetical protein